MRKKKNQPPLSSSDLDQAAGPTARKPGSPAVKLCPVVGIGASAGGLEAFTQLIQHLAVDTDMAFVLVQHMNRSRESLLPKLLSKATRMPVHQTQDGMVAEANHIYVIPPNTSMSFVDEKLRLQPRGESTAPHLPVDYFLRSLAEARGHTAIGVVLSGTGSDGVLGLTEIKAHGGITFAQDDRTAKFNGMPQSAVASGCVDFVLPPERIAKELSRIGCHPYLTVPQSAPGEVDFDADEQIALQWIFGALRSAKGVDFSHYKAATFRRRLARRITVNSLKGIPDYAEYLQKHPLELDALFKDILIHVTSFFRDPNAFEALKRTVFPALLQDRREDQTIRIWVPGCSTGEEVYSIAIAWLDFIGDRAPLYPIRIFATDVSEEIIGRARAGQFLENIAADVSSEQLKRYFEKSEGGYKISREVRDLCTFSKHNLINDPPFSRLDLISCRNVVIYWEPVLQKKILPWFHFALEPKRFLMMGSAETLRSFAPLFEPVDQKNQIYSKKSSGTRPDFHFARALSVSHSFVPSLAPLPSEPPSILSDPNLEADHIARKLYSPPSLLVNDQLEIFQFRGAINPYLGPMAGKASLQLLQMVPAGLAQDLAELIKQARAQDVMVQKADRQIEIQGQWRPVTLRVFPIRSGPAQERFFVIFFEENPPLSPASASRNARERRAKPMAPDKNAIEIAHLKQKLFAMETHLQATIEKSEALHEQLQSAHEETLTANEQLQASNEELETTKEELQSTNEELMTLNGELKSSSLQAYAARDRGRMVIETIRQPLLVLDPQFRVLEANQAFYDTFQTSLESTENQYLFDLGDGQWNIPELRTLLEGVLPSRQTVTEFQIEHDFPELGRKKLLLNARKVLRNDGDPERVLVAIEDITERRNEQDKLEEQERTRNAARSQDSLQQTRQLEAIGRLAGGVAHDFNNLMTGILGMAEELKSATPEDNMSHQENVEQIIQAAKKACILTKQLLAFGRRQVFAPRILNLNQVISEMSALLPRFLGENTEIKTVFEPDLALIRGDRGQLEQVILNLVTNSRDAMPRGGQVTLETANVDLGVETIPRHPDLKPGPYVQLIVSDTGCGMDLETLHRVFEPFFTTKEQGKGTGLGLATTYGIIKQHEGDVAVYSELGHGTTFKIYIPVAEAIADVERRTADRGTALKGSETILVVEDEPIVRRVATKSLQKYGYRTVEAGNGQEALDLLKTLTEPVDMLLTDIIMPGIDGRELAQRLRAEQPTMAVLFMSGYPRDIIVRDGMLEPGISFIEKSFSAESLSRKVREVLDGIRKTPNPSHAEPISPPPSTRI